MGRNKIAFATDPDARVLARHFFTVGEAGGFPLPYRQNDGGRAASGLAGWGMDCSVRAAAIATGLPYREVCERLRALARAESARCLLDGHIPLYGLSDPTGWGMTHDLMVDFYGSLGWHWTPALRFGRILYIRPEDLPDSVCVIVAQEHTVAVVDGAVHDLLPPSARNGYHAYGFFTPQPLLGDQDLPALLANISSYWTALQAARADAGLSDGERKDVEAETSLFPAFLRREMIAWSSRRLAVGERHQLNRVILSLVELEHKSQC